MPNQRTKLLLRMLIQTTIWLLIMAALLFLPAGTFRWPNAWIFLIILMITSYALGLWLEKFDPQLLKERLSSPFQPGQETWDRILIICLSLLFLIWLPVMALDAGRYHYSHVPIFLQIIGGLAILLCMYISYRTFKENTYAIPIVKIQKNREQRVIDTGPYRIVRHPLYTGALLFFFGTPLLLGSWLGLIGSLLLTILLAVRAIWEENTLKQKLTGYKDYMSKVRYRFIPHIW